MQINANTKIAALLKHHPNALETIISISSSFEKLRNPFLRKLMAGRTSISTASKISKCNIEDFYTKLEPLGFIVDRETLSQKKINTDTPSFISSLKENQILNLDVRPILGAGVDPLSIILEHIKNLPTHHVLKITNTFEPTPLINLLSKKGFKGYTKHLDKNTTETYLYKKSDYSAVDTFVSEEKNNDWDNILEQFQNKTLNIDVRAFEMPLPMIKILEAIEGLNPGTALFVTHKKIPVFLIPELVERKMSFRIKEIDKNEVHLLIFKE